MTESATQNVIVGAGATGALLAARLAEAGEAVTVIEAGPARELRDLTSSQIWARHLKWSGTPVIESGNLPVGHGFNCGYGTGGSALHHYGVWPRLHPNDFSVRQDHGVGLDWPIEYADLQPFYDLIQTEVGVSGDASLEKWRPPGTDYPLPAMPIFPQGKTIGRGFAALGLTTAPMPLAINSQPTETRPGCLFDGWCDAGCPTGALANPLVTYLPRAIAHDAQMIHEATVARVLLNASGSRAVGVEYYDRAGNTHRVMGDRVILAAFVVQNAKIMLQSQHDKHPNGLSNRNDLVGRYLMTHPSLSIYGLFEDETQPYLGATGGQLMSQDAYDNKSKADGAFGSYQWLIANALKPNDLLGIANCRPDIIGSDLHAFMQRASKHIATMVCVGEDLPNAENRITLDASTDQYGLPKASTVHNIDSATDQLMQQAQAQGLEVFKRAGAQESWSGPRAGMHILGGTIMGDDPSTSVTDSYGRCHELDNVYVTGTGLFPTSGGVNPTFTIHALAERTAQHLLAQNKV